ncbi:MAG: hypothetical protein ACXWMI_01720 [Syntrophales bacterium]
MVKKKLFFLYGAIVLTVVLTTACACIKPAAAETCQGSEANTNHCPGVWVEYRDAFYQGSPGDHTYVKFLKEDGQWQSFHCFGHCNGGKELPETKIYTAEANEKIVQCMADQMPCKWPENYYLIIGVCHQLANRGLFHTGKIVGKARMYNWTSFVYQTYGACFSPLGKYCMTECREASGKIGTWDPERPPTCTPSEMARSAEPDPEYQLYIKHFGDLKVTGGAQDMAARLKSYRYELLKLHIKQRLGDEYVREYLPILSKMQDELLEEKEKLDLQLLDRKGPTEDMVDEYNKLFNGFLTRFRAQFKERMDLYDKFFGLAYDEKIDMRIFKPGA